MNPTIIGLLDDIAALQIKVCALETMLLQDEASRIRYEEIVDAQAKKVIRAGLHEPEAIN